MSTGASCEGKVVPLSLAGVQLNAANINSAGVALEGAIPSLVLSDELPTAGTPLGATPDPH